MDEQTDGRTNENERTDKQKKIIFLKESLCFAQNLKKQVFLFSMILAMIYRCVLHKKEMGFQKWDL